MVRPKILKDIRKTLPKTRLKGHFGKVFKNHLSPNLPAFEKELILEDVLKRVGESPKNINPSRIGYGEDAQVFWLSDKKKVLKLTTNYEDAEASSILQHKPSPVLIKVFDVFEIRKHVLYGIVAEKLTPLTGAELQEWIDLSRIITESGDLYGLPYDWDGLTSKWLNEARAALPTIAEVSGQAFAKTFQAYLFQLRKWTLALEDRKIIWSDFHAGNIMHKGRHLVISDFGRSRVNANPRIPPLVR